MLACAGQYLGQVSLCPGTFLSMVREGANGQGQCADGVLQFAGIEQ